MQRGQEVKSKTYPEKGLGISIDVKSFAGKDQVLVFFERNREKLLLPGQDLVALGTPEDKLREASFSSADKFSLRFLLEQEKARKTQEGFKSAGGFKILPLPHQLLAVDFVLSRFKPRALIADEVGLGKTIEAALIYEELKARGMISRVMVVVPAGLCRQWQSEMKQKFNEDFAIYDKETIKALKQLHGTETNIFSINDKIITSMDFIKPRKTDKKLPERILKNRIWHNNHIYEAAVNAGFDLVIFDEAHKLAKGEDGDETARYKIGSAMAEAVPFFLMLTATPHQGDQDRFKNLLGLVDAHLFVSNNDIHPENVRKVTVRSNKRAAVDFEGKRIFKQRITSLYEIERDSVEDKIEIDLYNAVTEYVSESYEMAKQVNDRTTMFLLLIYQRMVSSSSRAVLKSLQKRLERLEVAYSQLFGLEDVEESEELVDENELDNLEETAAEEQLPYLEKESLPARFQKDKAFLEVEIGELKKCVDLARKAVVGRNDLKFIKLLKVIDEFKVRENDPQLKFIVFTEFVETQSYISECLKNLGYEVALINGSMSAVEKERQKEFFKEKAQFLVSTDAGGEGINLQFCRVMINYDLPWNPMRLEQRIGRIDRIGQEHDVKIINFQLQGTVEKRVRDVIENKLNLVKKQFNDGEDKLADILSTLQEEFDFEKIYIDAVRKRKQDDLALEEIAQDIFERAHSIIHEGELSLPFSEWESDHQLSKRELEKSQENARIILSEFLKLYSKKLNPYKDKKEVYYFDDPLTGKRYSQVFFHQEKALEHDGGHLISYTHPYIDNVLKHLDDLLVEDTTSKIRVLDNKFEGEAGFIFLFKLFMTNNIEPAREVIIPCFVGASGKVNQRISSYFEEIEKITMESLIKGDIGLNFELALKEAKTWAEQRAEGLFLQHQRDVIDKASEAEDKMNKYYLEKERSVQAIKIENIRESKLVELNKEREAMKADLKRRKQLVPYLECLQIAYVEFKYEK